jgi:hypothetical protein
MSKVWVVMGSVPWEYQDPIAAFDTEKNAQVFCSGLEARYQRHQDAKAKFSEKVNELRLTMSAYDAYENAGENPQAPEHDYPEYFVAEVDFYPKSSSPP